MIATIVGLTWQQLLVDILSLFPKQAPSWESNPYQDLGFCNNQQLLVAFSFVFIDDNSNIIFWLLL
ncbi:MAG: hypothetical protein RLZZ580_162 [Cyanobacteriota bacterium]|jgi:hypothetical protein